MIDVACAGEDVDFGESVVKLAGGKSGASQPDDPLQGEANMGNVAHLEFKGLHLADNLIVRRALAQPGLSSSGIQI